MVRPRYEGETFLDTLSKYMLANPDEINFVDATEINSETHVAVINELVNSNLLQIIKTSPKGEYKEKVLEERRDKDTWIFPKNAEKHAKELFEEVRKRKEM